MKYNLEHYIVSQRHDKLWVCLPTTGTHGIEIDGKDLPCSGSKAALKSRLSRRRNS